MDTRENLISTATELFLGRGYAAVGTTEICKTSGVNKGTFYHFFPSKSDLLVVTIQRYAEEFASSFTQIAVSDATPKKKLSMLFDVPAKANSDWKKEHGFAQGCLVGNVGLELASTDIAVRIAVASAMLKWADEISPVIEGLVAGGDLPHIDVTKGAELVVGLIQGGLLLAKIHDDPARITEMSRVALSALRGCPLKTQN